MRNTNLNAFVTRDHLIAASGKHQARVEPVWSAIRAGCGLLLLEQNGLCFDPPPMGMGAVIVIEDDTWDGTSGPDGFDAVSVHRLISRVDTISILPHGAVTEAFAAAATEAMQWGWSLVIQTRPEHELAWLLEVAMAAPRVQFMLDPRRQFWRSVR
ncbi:hypothetical protein SAMN04488144_14523 [Methylobacterium sp. 190mf]|uniref:hypothetical protein n=1 Tax=Methylobacterium sp. 190mf TaxID=1761798 RepID=UPI00089E5224|nr:hypothetical protein [Methylobacterium sp. 190mf]SEG69710.1 hypothetical protein SAMN04488144_14523 [Methylobacterium sp. 190mf]